MFLFKTMSLILTEKQANQSCEQMLQTTAFNGSDHDFIAEYNIYQLSDNQTGKYVCIAEITECVDEEDYTSTHQSVNLRVYTKPDYTTHLAGIAVLMILTLVLLFALIFFCRRIQRIQLQRYQELMSSTKIQFHPTKVILAEVDLKLQSAFFNSAVTLKNSFFFSTDFGTAQYCCISPNNYQF